MLACVACTSSSEQMAHSVCKAEEGTSGRTQTVLCGWLHVCAVISYEVLCDQRFGLFCVTLTSFLYHFSLKGIET